MLERTQNRLVATATTPWLGVHALTEFIFCPRAGIMAAEQGSTEEEYAEPANLRYLPNWSSEAIKREVPLVVARLAVLLLALLVLVAFCFAHDAPLGLSWGCRGGAVVIAVAVGGQLRKLLTLLRRLHLARIAVPKLPDESNHESEPVNWWSLLRAGFESVRYQEPLRDERWRLMGRPWRVLRYGGLRIPVFRLVGERRLRRQHYARMAAYCHLLETCEACRSPYGIVLFGETYEGVTVRNSPSSRKAFHDSLISARSIVQLGQRGVPAPGPSHENCCLRCPLGYPRVAARRWFGTSEGYPKRGVDGRLYHSSCGDRFEWVPPHEKAYRKALIAGRRR